MKKFIVIAVFSVLSSASFFNETLAGNESNEKKPESVTDKAPNSDLSNSSNNSRFIKNSLSKTSRREQRKALRAKENKVVEGSRRHVGGYITGAGIIIFILLILLL